MIGGCVTITWSIYFMVASDAPERFVFGWAGVITGIITIGLGVDVYRWFGSRRHAPPPGG